LFGEDNEEIIRIRGSRNNGDFVIPRTIILYDVRIEERKEKEPRLWQNRKRCWGMLFLEP